MKVLFVIGNNYLPQSAGGVESSTHQLCEALQNNNIKCAVLASLSNKKDSIFYKNRIFSKLTNTYAPSDFYKGYAVFRGWDASCALKSVIKKFKPSVVVVQSGEPAKLVKISLGLSCKTIAYIRDVEFDLHGGDYLPHPNLTVIANSQFTSNVFYKNFGIHSEVIPPSIDQKKYLISTPKKVVKKVVFINPHLCKGVDIAINLAKLNKDIPFLFVESWPLSNEDKSYYLTKIKSLPNVECLPRQSNMRHIYEQAKVILMPSIWEEAWGRVASEAHVNGIPVLASNIGGLPESVGTGGILLDPLIDINEWSKALNDMWNNTKLYQKLSQNAIVYSKRKEIQLSYITDRFIQHVQHVDKLDAIKI